MIDNDIEYERFINAAKYHAKNKGAGEIAYKYGCSAEYIYMIVNGKKNAGRSTQLKFAKACGFETVNSFIESCFPKTQLSTPEGIKETKTTKSPAIGNIIKVYNNILEKTGLDLDAEGQEKLFELIKRRLSEKTAEAAEHEITEIISLTDKRKKG